MLKIRISEFIRQLFCWHEWSYANTDETGIVTIKYGDGTVLEKKVFGSVRFCLKCGKIK